MDTMNGQIVDISLPLFPGMIVYPGNPAVEITSMKSATGDSVISRVVFGTHTGTHIDAPKHVIQGGKSLHELGLMPFIGSCQVLDCTQENGCVSIDCIKKMDIKEGERILLKTSNSIRGFQEFYNDYVYISPEAAAYLAKVVSLIGIDYLSVKQRGSKDNRPHTEFLSKNIPVIEGVDLSHVEPGRYQLIALPLKFIDIDGAPARVVLLK